MKIVYKKNPEKIEKTEGLILREMMENRREKRIRELENQLGKEHGHFFGNDKLHIVK